MFIRDEDHVSHVGEAGERELLLVETSDERFDRMAFARRALDLVCPKRTRVALCEGASRVHVESGKNWRGSFDRWAVFVVPPKASRRAIAFGAMALASPGAHPEPWALDVLLAEA
jgi:hypothetical protein